MSKSQNIKNEQQKDLCITSEQLTEQWKKGELPEGWYWVKRVTWSECINMLYNWSDTFLDGDVPVDNDEITEVLAKVPSYEEWKDLKSKLQLKDTAYDFDTARLEEENAQLKELLKECELWFTGIVGNMNDKNCGEHNRNLPIGNFEYMFKVFSQKINEALK